MKLPLPSRALRRAAGPRPAGPHRRRAAALAALALVAAGCGIRGTSVPVDAGGAPSRVSCKVPAGAPAAPDGVPVKIYLVCGSALVKVERNASLPKKGTGDRLRTARTLLDELQEQPSTAEEEAGFSSSVPRTLEVSGPAGSDPGDTLRLSTGPDDLPSFALAQIVCTYGESTALGEGRSVVLGGPGGDRPQRYDCSAEMLAHPDIAQHASWGRPLPATGAPDADG